MRRRGIQFLGRSLLLYTLSFLLLLEWLVPLPYVTDTGFIPLFIFSTLFFFMITFLQLPIWISIIVKFVAILFGIHVMFFSDSLLSIDWLAYYINDVVHNFKLLFTGQLLHLSNMFRSSLFFILLAMMSELLYYWTVIAKRALFFFVFTAIFVTVIDTFTEYDASFAIVRIFIIGFMLLGLVTMYRIIEKRKIAVHSYLLPLRLIVVLSFAVICASAFGFAAPKLEPQWGDPVPYMKAALGLAPGNFTAQKVGYSENDEQLGGGFQNDPTPAFYAVADKPTYWRGDAKEIYTGHGWISSNDQQYVVGVQPNLYEAGMQTEQRKASVLFNGASRFNHLFYLGEMTKLVQPNDPAIDLMTNVSSGKIYTYEHSEQAKFDFYETEYLAPEFPVTELRKVTAEAPSDSIYLQLPDTLPERVRELASEIVKDESNRYDKAKAIERYFRSSDYRYETEQVAVPNDEEDYVDQFLFETKQGYCDNFSTSMVVLLRSVHIPARWVKGFTQGKEIEKANDGRRIYEVTNANAHSWVEVYFPHYGWVPFEPTQSFFSPFEFDYGEEAHSLDELTVEQEEEEERLENEEKEDNSSKGMKRPSWTMSFPLLFGLLLFLGVSVILYIMRWKWMSRYFVHRYYNRKDERAFELAYASLLTMLSRKGYRRNDQETMREYALRIDEVYQSEEMSQLAEAYERIMYAREDAVVVWRQKRDLWKVLIQRIAS